MGKEKEEEREKGIFEEQKGRISNYDKEEARKKLELRQEQPTERDTRKLPRLEGISSQPTGG
jgi:hypothetical protein